MTQPSSWRPCHCPAKQLLPLNLAQCDYSSNFSQRVMGGTSTSTDINYVPCKPISTVMMGKQLISTSTINWYININSFLNINCPSKMPSSPHVAAWWECCASSHPHARAAESSRPDLGLAMPTAAANPLVRHLSSMVKPPHLSMLNGAPSQTSGDGNILEYETT